jgi:hypothetical protein
LKKQIEEVKKERLAICNTCTWNSKFHKAIRPDEHCTICDCTLSAKTACLSCECPLMVPKWKAVLTDEQETLLKTKDNEGDKSE